MSPVIDLGDGRARQSTSQPDLAVPPLTPLRYDIGRGRNSGVPWERGARNDSYAGQGTGHDCRLGAPAHLAAANAPAGYGDLRPGADEDAIREAEGAMRLNLPD